MRRWGGVGLLGAFVVLGTLVMTGRSALAAFPDLEADCASDDSALAVDGCTSLLQNKKQPAAVRALTYARRAYAHTQNRDYDLAVDDYTDAIRLDPNNADHYNNRGLALAKLGEQDLAIDDYNKAIGINPSNGIVYDNRGLAYEAMGDSAKALADYNKSLQLNPTDTYALHDHARLSKAMGNLEAAIADYTALLRLDLGDATAFEARGNIYLDRGDYQKAIADFTSAMLLMPKEPAYAGDRAFAYQQNGDYDLAIADYTKQISLDPEGPYGYSGRANAYADKGDYKSAIPDYTKAISIDMNAYDYRSRGLAYFFSGAPDKALADFRKSLEGEAGDSYTALWVEVAAQRSKAPSTLKAATAKLDMGSWPAPIVRMYLGEITPDALFAAAKSPNPQTNREQVCEANVYAGEMALWKGAKADAAAMLQAAAKDCPSDFIEAFAAKAELKLLAATP